MIRLVIFSWLLYLTLLFLNICFWFFRLSSLSVITCSVAPVFKRSLKEGIASAQSVRQALVPMMWSLYIYSRLLEYLSFMFSLWWSWDMSHMTSADTLPGLHLWVRRFATISECYLEKKHLTGDAESLVLCTCCKLVWDKKISFTRWLDCISRVLTFAYHVSVQSNQIILITPVYNQNCCSSRDGM